MKHTLLESLNNPYDKKENLPFVEYIKTFTGSISHLHAWSIPYDVNDLHPDIRERYASTEFMEEYEAYSINLADCPKTYTQLNMDSKGYLPMIYDYRRPLREENATRSKYLKSNDYLQRKFRTLDNLLNVGMNIQEWRDKYEYVDYKINSLGLRSHLEFEDLEPNKFIPVFGCSNTFGLGTKYENLWFNQLDEDLPRFNLGMSSNGVVETLLTLKKLYKEKPFKKAYAVLPHCERTAHISNKGWHEGGSFYQSTLNEWVDLNKCFNSETRMMYVSICYGALLDFCKVNDIELNIYATFTYGHLKHCVEWQMPVPNSLRTATFELKDIPFVNPKTIPLSEMQKHVARDCVHFGVTWHSRIAELFKEPENKYLNRVVL